jgi:hypothetical protein
MIRELKLYDLCGEVSPNVIEITELFNDLFSDLSVYTKDEKPDLIFMRDGEYIMSQDLKNGYLWCRYTDFWEVLQTKFKLQEIEIQEVILYKLANMVEEYFKKGSLTIWCSTSNYLEWVEDAFKTGSLTPLCTEWTQQYMVEDAFKTGFFNTYKIIRHIL